MRIRDLFKVVAYAVSVILLVLALYTVKSLAGIDVFKSISWEQYWPLRLWPWNVDSYNEKVLDTTKTDLLSDSFENGTSRKLWLTFWAEPGARIDSRYAAGGYAGGRCLYVKNNNGKFWTYQQRNLVKVKNNEWFGYEGRVKRADGRPEAAFSVIVYNADKKVIRWNDAGRDITPSKEWVLIRKEFQTPAGASYLRFRISGSGVGETKFDDIRFLRKSRKAAAAQETVA